MNRLKITSVIVSIAMCMSMIFSPVSVIADETSSTSEAQTTEETEKQEPKETEKQKPTETDKEKPVETEKQKPDETKVTSESTKALETEKNIETETPAETTETIKETEQSESAETTVPSESSEPSKNAEETTETSMPSESAQGSTESTVPSGTLPQTTTKQKAKNTIADDNIRLYFGRYVQSLVTDQRELDLLDLAEFKNGETVIDNIRFKKKDGKYYRDEPIEWRVIDSEGGYYTLISDKVIDKRTLDYSDAFWSTCGLRTWLNSDFLNVAFTEKEQADIAISKVDNVESDYDNNPNGGTPRLVETNDKVYLLIKDDFIDNYYGFLNETDRIAYATEWVDINKSATRYWLRGPKLWSYGNKKGYYIDANGTVGSWYHTYSYGIRPVIKVSKDSEYLYKTKPIYELPPEITISDSTLYLAVGKKYTLVANGISDVTFKSSNKKIAKVSATGVVTALKPGTVTITAYSKSDESKSITCTVIVKYRINYVLNGGTNSIKNLEYYTGKMTLSNPSRAGYTFKGWFTSSKYTKKSKVTSVKNANKTVYAKWAANTYKVRYNKNGGSGSQSDQSCKYGTGYKINSCKFSRTGYTFVCWNTQADGSGQVYKPGDPIKNLTTKNGGVVTLYAQWSLITYKITYSGVPEGITNNNKTSYTVTTPTFTLEAPSTRENYTFKYWFVNVKKKVKKKTTTVEQKITSIAKGSTGNKTIYAKWALNAYTIKFNANGGTGKMDNQSCNVTKEYKIRANAFSRKGWTFTGWNTKSDGSGASYANNQSIMDLCTQNGDSIILYAQWKINEYTITYNVPDGTVNNNKTTFTIETDTFELKAPNCPGYTFQYWYMNVKKTKTVKKKKKTVTVQQKITSIAKGSTGNKILYAKLAANKYTITFDANGGTGKQMTIVSCVYGKEYTLPKNTYKPMEGYSFAGWNTKKDGSGISYDDGAKVKNLAVDADVCTRLYAQWIPDNRLYWPVRKGANKEVKNYISSHPGDYVAGNPHRGIDIGDAVGADWYSASEGTIEFIFTGCNTNGNGDHSAECNPNHPELTKYGNGCCNAGFGNGFVIKSVIDGKIYMFQYAHMSEINTDLKVGQQVHKGTYLGKVGDRGFSFETHAHFEIDRIDYYNPNSDTRYWGEAVNNDPERGSIFEYYY